tara:strand:- start:740 stop:880 length:141 start_codon:yes stop_codon:yes gene_type:complete
MKQTTNKESKQKYHGKNKLNIIPNKQKNQQKLKINKTIQNNNTIQK